VTSRSAARPAPPDHYATLGVSDTAPHATIRASYRRIIRATHPDVTGGDPVAAARAARVTEAWTVLKDPLRRAGYDRARTAARVGSPTAGTPLWGPAGPRPVSAEQLREAARRQSAFGAIGRAQRERVSAASWRVGLAVILLGGLLLALVSAR
jgi:curved DNA-binding protein CbpA